MVAQICNFLTRKVIWPWEAAKLMSRAADIELTETL